MVQKCLWAELEAFTDNHTVQDLMAIWPITVPDRLGLVWEKKLAIIVDVKTLAIIACIFPTPSKTHKT